MKVYEYIIRLKDEASDRISRFVRNVDNSRSRINELTNGTKRVDAATKSFAGSLSQASNRLVKYYQDAKEAARSNNALGDSFGFLKRWIGTAVITTALTAGAMKASALSREFEQTQISFEVMLGNAKKGRDMLADIEQMAIVTPFKSSELQSSGKLLLGYGVNAQKILPTLRMLGDIAGGNSEKLHYLSLAFAQSQAAGRLMGQDLLQMVNAGFNPLQTISEKTGISIGDLKKKMEDGAISASIVEAAFRSATQEGGRFFNMMEKQSQTFEGRLNALSEKTEIWMRGIGNNINSFLSPLIEVAIDKMDELLDKGNKLVADSNKQRDYFRNLQTNIRPLVREYQQLTSATSLSAKESERLKKITAQIGQAIPSSVSKYDNYGKALAISPLTAIYNIDENERFFKLQNKEAQDEVVKKLEGIQLQKKQIDFALKDQGTKANNKDYNVMASTGLARMQQLSEEETRLRNQLSQLRNDQSLAYLKGEENEKKDDWKKIGDEINSGGKKKKGSSVDGITGGGKQPINVTINVQTLNGIQNVEEVNGTMEIGDLMKMMEKMATEAVIRVVNSGNYVQQQN